MSVVVLVLAIIAGVILLQAAIWIPLLRLGARKRKEFEERFSSELARTGETIVRGPEKAVYRGSTGNYGKVKGNGKMWLTDHRIVFCKIMGGVVEIPASKIKGTHEAKSFLRGVVSGFVHLVVDTDDPAEVGFFTGDNDGWRHDIEVVTKSS